jgi:transcriptional regulator with XRE-family HTH domain
MALTINIRSIRKDRGLTLEQVAAKIGVSVPHLSGVERGKKNLNNHLMTRLADTLGVPVESLIGDRADDKARMAHILDQLGADDRARVEAFAEALLRLQEASGQAG